MDVPKVHDLLDTTSKIPRASSNTPMNLKSSIS